MFLIVCLLPPTSYGVLGDVVGSNEDLKTFITLHL
jgi:hypothetical protein